MSGSSTPAADEATENLILDVFRERHRHDLSLRDDVFLLTLAATALILAADKLALLPKVLP